MKKYKREWNLLLPNFKSNVGFSGLFALGVTLLLFGINNNSLTFITLGIVFATLIILVFVISSLPPKKLNSAKEVGNIIELTEIDKYHPRIMRLGVLGVSSTGKTTFANGLRSKPMPNRRTQTLSVKIFSTNNNPNKYIGIIDGPGNLTSDQFQVLKNSEVIIVMLDHNSSREEISVNQSRLDLQKQFLFQLKNYIHRNNLEPQKILLVLNKKDLWNQLSDADKDSLTNWFENEVQDWENGNYSKVVLSTKHSNWNSQDCFEVINKLNL